MGKPANNDKTQEKEQTFSDSFLSTTTISINDNTGAWGFIVRKLPVKIPAASVAILSGLIVVSCPHVTKDDKTSQDGAEIINKP
jgi:hypothetical protein